MYTFDPYDVLLSIAVNIAVMLMTVLQGHVCVMMQPILEGHNNDNMINEV